MRFNNDWFNTKEGHSSGSRLGFNGTREWCHDDGTGLSLPESIDDGALFLADVVVIPVPSLGVDRLTNGTQYSESTEIVAVDVVLSETAEETDGGWSRVEVGKLVLLNGLPVTRWGRVDGRRFEDSGGDTVEKRPVDDVTDGTCEI